MSLEEKYLNAARGTYVGSVRLKQAPFTTAGAPNTDAGIVNFMDGTPRRGREDDEFQTEFKRNQPNAYTNGGAQGTVPVTSDKSYTLSRWTERSLKLAFEQDGPTSLDKGYYINRFRTAITPKGTTMVHNYTPLNNSGYINKSIAALAKYNGSPSLSPNIE